MGTQVNSHGKTFQVIHGKRSPWLVINGSTDTLVGLVNPWGFGYLRKQDVCDDYGLIMPEWVSWCQGCERIVEHVDSLVSRTWKITIAGRELFVKGRSLSSACLELSDEELRLIDACELIEGLYHAD